MDDETAQVLRHRLDAHRAALRAAALLGNPPVLVPLVARTRVALAELIAIMEELHG